MLGCEILFTATTALAVRTAVRAATPDGQCPCEADKRCPLLSADLGPLLTPKGEASAA